MASNDTKTLRTLQDLIACGSLANIAAPATKKFAEASTAKDAAEANLAAMQQQLGSSDPRARFQAQDAARAARRAVRVAEFDLVDARKSWRAAMAHAFHHEAQPAFQAAYQQRLARVDVALTALAEAAAGVVELEVAAGPFTLPTSDVTPCLSPLSQGDRIGERLTATIQHFSAWLTRLTTAA